MMIGMTIDVVENSAWSLRTAALGALVFDVFYVVHRLLQGLGPGDATPAEISAFSLAHRSALLASEVAVGFALLAVIVFIAAFTSLIRQAGRDTLATAVTVSGTAFVALGFISQAAETALVGVVDAGDQSAVLALNHLQGRIPIVWTISALTVAVSVAGQRTRLLPTWLGVAGLVAAGVFVLGSMSSVLGRTVEGRSSLFGVGLFIVWFLLVALCLWRAAGTAAPESDGSEPG
jgi:hypothetical protein